jgi:secreted trypsin-like serine protease
MHTQLEPYFTLAIRLAIALAIFLPSDGNADPLATKTAPIVGGNPAEPGRYPDMAALVFDGFIIGCGGTLIAPRAVLTAAHCIERGPLTHVALDTAHIGEPGPMLAVARVEVAPAPLDLAVVFVEEPAPLAPRALHGACAPAHSLAGAVATVAGYGATETDGGGSTRELLLGEVTVTAAECGDPSMGCIDTLPADAELIARGAADTCQGDSGGPLYVQAGGQTLLAGVAARGLASAQVCGQGGIYVRVDSALAWIASAVGHEELSRACEDAAPSGCNHSGAAGSGLGVLGLLGIAALGRRLSGSTPSAANQTRRRSRWRYCPLDC